MLFESVNASLKKLNKLPYFEGLRYGPKTFYGENTAEQRANIISQYTNVLSEFPDKTVLDTDAGTDRMIKLDERTWTHSKEAPPT